MFRHAELGWSTPGRARLGQDQDRDLRLLLSRGTLVSILALTALAFLIRLTLILTFDEAPGDGPMRAIFGYYFQTTRHISFYAHWLQGHSVMIGLLLWLVPDPALAGRALSLLAGTVSVPLIIGIGRHLFGWRAGFLAGLALAINPMHAALSATSLSEVVMLAATLGILAATFAAAENPRRVGAWIGIAFAALIGTSVRFEFWLVLPVVTFYHGFRTGSFPRTVLLVVLLLPFPLVWFIGRMQIGGVGLTYAGAVSGLEEVGARAVDLLTGGAILLDTLYGLLGGPLLWLAVLGLTALVLPAIRPARRAEVAALVALLALEALFLTKFAADLGNSFWPRYAAGTAVLLLPFAAYGLAAVIRPRLVAGTAAALALVAMVAAPFVASVDLYLVREIPEATRAIAEWIKQRPAGEKLLLTRMGWQSSYIPLIARLESDRYRIVSHWLPDDQLRWFACDEGPAYVVTRESDLDLLERLRRVAGVQPRFDAPLTRHGRIVALPFERYDCAAAG